MATKSTTYHVDSCRKSYPVMYSRCLDLVLCVLQQRFDLQHGDQINNLSCVFQEAVPGHVQRVIRCMVQLATTCHNHSGEAWVDWQPSLLVRLLRRFAVQQQGLKQYYVACVVKDISQVNRGVRRRKKISFNEQMIMSDKHMRCWCLVAVEFCCAAAGVEAVLRNVCCQRCHTGERQRLAGR